MPALCCDCYDDVVNNNNHNAIWWTAAAHPEICMGSVRASYYLLASNLLVLIAGAQIWGS